MNIRTTLDGKMLVEDAQIMRGIFRNFSGEKEGRYDQKGRRYFNMLIDDPAIAQKMMADNLPVKILAPRDPEDEPQHIMKISMKPENRYFPCKVRTVCNGVLTTLDPDDHGWDILDTAEITSADLTIRLWEYNPGDYSAQLEEGIFTIQPLSYWASKYAEEEHPVE